MLGADEGSGWFFRYLQHVNIMGIEDFQLKLDIVA